LIETGQNISFSTIWTDIKNAGAWKGPDLVAKFGKTGDAVSKAGSLINLWNYGTTGNAIWMCGIGR
jgi:hypothetical protein